MKVKWPTDKNPFLSVNGILSKTQWKSWGSMTIKSTNTTYGIAVWLAYHANYNTIQNCSLEAPATTTSSYAKVLLASGSATSYSSSGIACTTIGMKPWSLPHSSAH